MSLPLITSAAPAPVQSIENRSANRSGFSIKSCATKTYEIIQTVTNHIPNTLKGVAIGATVGAATGGVLANLILCAGVRTEKANDTDSYIPNPLFCSFEQVYESQTVQAERLDQQNRFAFGCAVVGAIIGGAIGGLKRTTKNTADMEAKEFEVTEIEVIEVEATTSQAKEETEALITNLEMPPHNE